MELVEVLLEVNLSVALGRRAALLFRLRHRSSVSRERLEASGGEGQAAVLLDIHRDGVWQGDRGGRRIEHGEGVDAGGPDERCGDLLALDAELIKTCGQRREWDTHGSFELRGGRRIIRELRDGDLAIDHERAVVHAKEDGRRLPDGLAVGALDRLERDGAVFLPTDQWFRRNNRYHGLGGAPLLVDSAIEDIADGEFGERAIICDLDELERIGRDRLFVELTVERDLDPGLGEPTIEIVEPVVKGRLRRAALGGELWQGAVGVERRRVGQRNRRRRRVKDHLDAFWGPGIGGVIEPTSRHQERAQRKNPSRTRRRRRKTPRK